MKFTATDSRLQNALDLLCAHALTELEEPELPYQGILSKDGRTPGRELYGEIVTANTLCHQFSI